MEEWGAAIGSGGVPGWLFGELVIGGVPPGGVVGGEISGSRSVVRRTHATKAASVSEKPVRLTSAMGQ